MKAESAKSMVRVTVAKALAEAFVGGVDNASEEKRPLTQLQQQDMLIMHLMAYRGAVNEAESLIDVEEILRMVIR